VTDTRPNKPGTRSARRNDRYLVILARRVARLNAVQALYQMEISGQGLEYVTEGFTRHDFGATPGGQRLANCNKDLFCKLVSGAVSNQLAIDRLASSLLREGWSLGSIDPTLRAVFRAAGAEMMDTDLEPRIIIKEYLEVTDAFFPKGRQVSLVNGVLDSMARHLRPDAFA